MNSFATSNGCSSWDNGGLACRWHIQVHGIPQGAATSPLLCGLFVSNAIHDHILPSLNAARPQPSHPAKEYDAVPALLMHLADDFLCLATGSRSSQVLNEEPGSKEPRNVDSPVDGRHAEAIAQAQVQAVATAGAAAGLFAAEKMHANCALAAQSGQPLVAADQIEAWVPWCGVLLCPATMTFRVRSCTCLLYTSPSPRD